MVGSQETPGVAGKFGFGVQNEARQRLIEFCQENTLVITNTLFQLHKRRLYTWTSLDGQYRNQIDYILCSQRWRRSMLLLLLLQLSCFSRVRLCATPEMAPTRLPHPWDSPGKNTGVGCHFLLQCMKVKSESEVVQSCPTPSDPADCCLPGSSVHRIFQARVLEWGAIAFSEKEARGIKIIFRLSSRLTDSNTNCYKLLSALTSELVFNNA